MVVIKRFDVLKNAGFIGIYSFFLGIMLEITFYLFPLTLFTLFFPLSPGTTGFGWKFFILFPIIFGIISFIGGFITLLVMNFALKITKGIGFDVEISGHIY